MISLFYFISALFTKFVSDELFVAKQNTCKGTVPLITEEFVFLVISSHTA